MKKQFFLLSGILLFVFACQKQVAGDTANEVSVSSTTKAKPSKIDICHHAGNGNWNRISINMNAWPAHKAHGDVRLDDQDGDGYVPNNACGFGKMGDCDDENTAIHPGAAEICGNGIDDNCNGQVDEDCFATVKICNQTWMQKNLDVDRYRNGDLIPKVTDPAIWANLTTGAYCYYNNDSARYAAVYGKLYNGYAITDPRGLAPKGWHIPADEEWAALVDCLGGEALAGGALKETGTAHWVDNLKATNSSGFTALPAGCIHFNGQQFVFFGLGTTSFWWSATVPEASQLWYRFLVNYNGFINRDRVFQYQGFSVRCVRD